MSKRLSLSAALALAVLTTLPGTSEARDCRAFDRVTNGTKTVVNDTMRMFRRAGDTVVRTGDKAVGWMFHRRKS